MAERKVYTDLNGMLVNTLKNFRLLNLTTAQRLALGAQLSEANIGLPCYDTTLFAFFIWGGASWVAGGSGTPGGNNRDIQFNDNGGFGGSDQLLWSTSNDLLVGTITDNGTGRVQIMDSTGAYQLGLHFDNDNYAEFLVDGAGTLTIAPIGQLQLTSAVLSSQSIYIGTGSFLTWGTPSSFATVVSGNVDGNLSLFDSSLSTFGLLQFGGLDASHPAIKRNATNLEIKVADDSTYSNLGLSKLLMQQSVLGSPVNGTLETDYTNLYFTLGGVRKAFNFGVSISLSTTGTTGAATLLGSQLNIPIYQGQLTLTTTGTTGISTLVGNTLNIPNYTAPSGYTLPPATTSTLGGVIVGSNLWVNSSGLLNLQASGVTSALGYTPVQSVFGRTGVITAQNGDYNTSQVTENTNLYFTNARAIGSVLTGYVSGAGTISATDSILSAIQKLNGNISGLVTGVSSVFGRAGAVTAQNGDYNTSQVTENTNLYFTNARAIGSTLTGYISGAGTITSSDSVLTAIEKLNGNTASLVTGVSSVSNSDGTLIISPTTGAVIASLALNNANSWGAVQTFSPNIVVPLIYGGSASGSTLTLASTSNATKNNIYFGSAQTSFFSEANNYMQIQRNALGSTISSANLQGLLLTNTTAATSGQNQYSPGLVMSGQAWTTTSLVSQNAQAMFYLQPLNGTTTVSSQIGLAFQSNGGAWTTGFAFSSAATNWTFGAAGLTINPVGGAGISVCSLPASAGHFNYATPTFTFEQVGALTTAGFGTTFINGSGASTNTTGNVNQYQFVQSFSPTSGTGTFSLISLQPTINQTGGANGITAALTISPTLTAASNFFAIQVLLGNSLFAACTTSAASIRLPAGTAPTTPVVGDMWVAGGHLFVCLTAGVATQIV